MSCECPVCRLPFAAIAACDCAMCQRLVRGLLETWRTHHPDEPFPRCVTDAVAAARPS